MTQFSILILLIITSGTEISQVTDDPIFSNIKIFTGEKSSMV